MPSDIPNLDRLFESYLDEDFDLIGDWPEVVDHFAMREPHRVPGTIAELADVLRRDLDDAELDQLLTEHRCAYFVEPEGARAFLEGIRDRLTLRLAERS